MTALVPHGSVCIYRIVPLAVFCFVFVNHVLVTRQHESGDFFTLSDPFSVYYVGHRGPPATHHPSEEFGLSMIIQYKYHWYDFDSLACMRCQAVRMCV